MLNRTLIAGSLFLLHCIGSCVSDEGKGSVDEGTLRTPDCYPPLDTSRLQYVVGYGSLMRSHSKNRTNPETGPNIPVHIAGYVRGWNCQGDSMTMTLTSLGVHRHQNASINGVVFTLPNGSGIEAYDEREEKYCRHLVPFEMIKLAVHNLEIQLSPSAQYWIYVTKKEFVRPADHDHPIVQSYVDLFLGGCIELEEKYGLKDKAFAEDCVKTTTGWDSPWENDRLYPRRPLAIEPFAVKVDKLLKKLVPKVTNNIKL